MNFTLYKSETKVFKRTKHSKGTKLKKGLKKIPNDLVIKLLILFVIKHIL